ncbi:MAG: RNA methyltransferase [Rectinemataceae bacterium]|nr:RNA methyltransferase [Rectinemataceae bacterium]
MNNRNTKTLPSALPDGSILLEGAWLVERALVSGLEVPEILCVPSRRPWAEALLVRVAAESAGSSTGPAFSRPILRIMPEKDLSQVAGYAFHRGVLAHALRPREQSAADMIPGGTGIDRKASDMRDLRGMQGAQGALILALPETVDPENLGACFRNAAAFGCTGLLIGPKCPDPLCRRVLRVSMGASLSLPWARMQNPDSLQNFGQAGFTVAACVLDPDAADLRTWHRPPLLVLVLGNEAYGLSPEWLVVCTSRLTLPMGAGTDSLNVATAGAVFLFALTSPDAERHKISKAG